MTNLARKWTSVLFVSALVGSGSGLWAPASFADKLQCSQMPILISAYLNNHYAYKSLTDDIKAHTIEQFITNLDPSRTLLLDSEVVKLKKDLPAVFSTMAKGNCNALVETHDMIVARVKSNEKFVKEFLGKDYKLDQTETLVVDPEKRGYMKTAEDRDKLMKTMIHFQVLSSLAADNANEKDKKKWDASIEKAKKQLIKRYELATKRSTELKPDEMVTAFMEAFATGLDPHSSYLSQDSLEDFQIHMQLSLEGIGASLSSEDGYTVVQEVIPGGSADRAKVLEPKDKIVAVGQGAEAAVNVVDMDLRDVVKLIRGKKGTKVRLTVQRQKEKTTTFETVLVRDKVDIKDSAANINYDTRKVGGREMKLAILDLPSFYGGQGEGARSSYKDVKDLLAQAKAKKVDGLVLDLTRNGGGLLQDAVRISGLFLRKGPVVATQDTQGRKEVLADEDSETEFPGPMVILTSRLSASASEILTGALKDYHRALVVGGDHTFGKGTVQVLNMLPGGLGGMKVTTGMYFLPNGPSTQHTGVPSDVVLPSVFSTDDIGEKILPYSLPNASIPLFAEPNEANAKEGPAHWTGVDPAMVQKVVDASKKRVEKDTKFQEILKETAEIEKNKGVVKLSELLKKSESENKKDKEKDKVKSETAEGRRKLALDTPQLKETLNILADWIAVNSGTPLTSTATGITTSSAK